MFLLGLLGHTSTSAHSRVARRSARLDQHRRQAQDPTKLVLFMVIGYFICFKIMLYEYFCIFQWMCRLEAVTFNWLQTPMEYTNHVVLPTTCTTTFLVLLESRDKLTVTTRALASRQPSLRNPTALRLPSKFNKRLVILSVSKSRPAGPRGRLNAFGGKLSAQALISVRLGSSLRGPSELPAPGHCVLGPESLCVKSTQRGQQKLMPDVNIVVDSLPPLRGYPSCFTLMRDLRRRRCCFRNALFPVPLAGLVA